MNESTRSMMQAGLRHSTYDPRTWVRKVWGTLGPALRSLGGQPGVAILVAEVGFPYEIKGLIWVRPGDLPKAVIIGRHSHCDIRVESVHTELSLRHLAVLVHWSDHGLTARILDLETASGFADETGSGLRSVTFAGSAFFSLGSLAFAVLETGRGEPLHGPEAFYDALPPRVRVEERGSKGGGRRADPVVFRATVREADEPSPEPREVTQVVSRQPSTYLTDPPQGGQTLGRLQVWQKGHGGDHLISDRAMDRGVMLGRYERCSLLVDGTSVSRVHLLLIRCDDRWVVVDTASTNGVFRHEGDRQVEVSVAALEDGARFTFGDAEFTWYAAEGPSDPRFPEVEAPSGPAVLRPEGATRRPTPRVPTVRQAPHDGTDASLAALGVTDPVHVRIVHALEAQGGLMMWGTLAARIGVSEFELPSHLQALSEAMGAPEPDPLGWDAEARLVRLDLAWMRRWRERPDDPT